MVVFKLIRFSRLVCRFQSRSSRVLREPHNYTARGIYIYLLILPGITNCSSHISYWCSNLVGLRVRVQAPVMAQQKVGNNLFHPGGACNIHSPNSWSEERIPSHFKSDIPIQHWFNNKQQISCGSAWKLKDLIWLCSLHHSHQTRSASSMDI